MRGKKEAVLCGEDDVQPKASVDVIIKHTLENTCH